MLQRTLSHHSVSCKNVSLGLLIILVKMCNGEDFNFKSSTLVFSGRIFYVPSYCFAFEHLSPQGSHLIVHLLLCCFNLLVATSTSTVHYNLHTCSYSSYCMISGGLLQIFYCNLSTASVIIIFGLSLLFVILVLV